MGFGRLPLLGTLAVLACLCLTVPATAVSAGADSPATAAAKKKRKKKVKTCRVTKRGALYRTPGYGGACKTPKTNPAPPLPPVTLGPGRQPNVLVDNAGTAHIVWNQEGGDGPDLLRYCRLKRGSTSCDNPPATQAQFPAQPGTPGFNEDFSGPRILAIGDDIAILTHRYPNVVDKPDGASSRTTYMWVSDDGGNSFTGPAIVGDAEMSGGAAVFGTPDAPRIGLISDTKTGGTFFQAIAPGTYNGQEANLGGGGPDRAYYGSLATVDGRPLAAFSDLTNTTYIRQWTGNGNPNDPSTWSETTLAGPEPRVTSGPNGAFIVNKPRDRLEVRRLNGITPGPPVVVSTTASASRDLFEDSGGDLHLGWVDRDALDKRLLERASSDGSRFGGARILAQSAESLSDVDLGATRDGGGFALYTAGGNSQSFGTIQASPFGNQRATGLPGLGSLPGGGADPNTTTTCQEVSYGAVQILADQGCLLSAPGKKGVKVSEGTLRLNGLEIVPDANVKILVGGGKERTIDTTGRVTVQLRAPGGPIVLFRGELHIKLPTGSAGVKLASFDTSKFPVDIKGFGVSGDVDVILRNDAVEIPISITLPKAFGGITGATTLRADNKSGLHIDSVSFKANQVLLGPLILRNLEVSWTASSETWTGGGEVTLIGVGLELRATFQRGAFKEGFVKVTPVPFPGVALFTDVYLNSVSGRLGIDPTFIEAGALVGAQPISPPDTYALGIDARMRVTIKPVFAIDFNGDGKLAIFPVFNASLHGDADGYFSARARAQLDIADIISAGGGFDGFFDADKGTFGATMKLNGCLGEPPLGVCSGFSATVSSNGIAGCAGGFIGFGYRWGKGGELLGPPSCDLGDYEIKGRAAGARAAQSTQGFTLAAGLPTASVKLTGAGDSPPSVVLISPSGARITPVPVSSPNATSAPAVIIGSGRVAQVGLRRPAGGAWRVEPQGGSSITEIAVANGLSAPSVTARVAGRGRKRVLVYRATRRSGLQVRFYEKVGAGARQIGATSAARGRIRFTSGDGRGGRRQIVAVVEQNGLPRLNKAVAGYRAPGPIRPPRPKGLRARRSGRSVVVRWRRSSGAATYAVRITVSDGRRLLQVLKGRRVRIGGVARSESVRVSVAGRSAHGRLGKAARARVKRR